MRIVPVQRRRCWMVLTMLPLALMACSHAPPANAPALTAPSVESPAQRVARADDANLKLNIHCERVDQQWHLVLIITNEGVAPAIFSDAVAATVRIAPVPASPTSASPATTTTAPTSSPTTAPSTAPAEPIAFECESRPSPQTRYVILNPLQPARRLSHHLLSSEFFRVDLIIPDAQSPYLEAGGVMSVDTSIETAIWDESTSRYSMDFAKLSTTTHLATVIANTRPIVNN